jgi:hypothetical protein
MSRRLYLSACVKQLRVEQQAEVFKYLLLQQWGEWEALSRCFTDTARVALMLNRNVSIPARLKLELEYSH